VKKKKRRKELSENRERRRGEKEKIAERQKYILVSKI
jgi:hypothetical protein